jgi:hypothetical protein
MQNTDRSYLWPGVPMALASAILFGASTPFSKLLLGEVDPQLLAGLLYLGAGGGLAIVRLGRAAIGLPAPESPQSNFSGLDFFRHPCRENVNLSFQLVEFPRFETGMLEPDNPAL